MVIKKFKFSVIAVAVIMIVAVAIGLASKKPNFGLEFNGQYLIKADIKEEFDSADLQAALQPLKKDLGDISVTSAKTDYAIQAMIRVQNTNDTLTASVMEKVQSLYKNAVYRGTNVEGAPFTRGDLVGYVGMLLGTVVITALYILLRQGLNSAAGSVISAVGAMLTANALMVIFRIPIGLLDFVVASVLALTLSFIYSALLHGKARANMFNVSDLSQSEKLANACIAGSLKGVICSAIVFLAFGVAGWVLGNSIFREFLPVLMIGLMCGIFYPVFIGLPTMLLLGSKSEKKTKQHAKAKK